MTQPVYAFGDYARLTRDVELEVVAPTASQTFTAFSVLFARQFQVIKGRYFVQCAYSLQVNARAVGETLPTVHLALFVDGVQQSEGAEHFYQGPAPMQISNIHFAGAFQNAVSLADGGRLFEVRWRGLGQVPDVNLSCRPVSFPSEEGVSVVLMRLGQ